MRPLDQVFNALAGSAFRRRLKLSLEEHAYMQRKGLPLVMQHAERFIDTRLAPAQPKNDGRQTPFHGHPVFVAQHATATCCRTCIEKWHAIGRGQALDMQQRGHVLAALHRWLSMQERRNT